MSRISVLDESILVVDDNETNIQFLATLLDNEGYSVRAATGGEMAVSAVKRVLPDLILLDVMMPVMDGYETIHRIRDIPGGENVPVIFLTAKIEEADIIRGFEEGAVDYVKKPFNSMELLARIKTHLKIRRRDKSIERNDLNQKYLLQLLTQDLGGNLSGMDSMAMWALQDQENNRGWELANYIRVAVTSSMELIETAKQFMELELNRSFLALAETELEEAINHTLKDINENIITKELELKTDLQYDGLIRAEKVTLINTVFKTIINNAIEISPHGGMISIKSEKQSDVVMVTISNTGTGSSEPIDDQLFMPDRVQGENGTENKTRKNFGLFLAGRLIEIFGASIDIQPSADGGTDMSIHFQIP